VQIVVKRFFIHFADIERVSKYLKQKPQQFIEQYLRIDEDQDYGKVCLVIFWTMKMHA
jgi:hypothetical protein